MRLIGFVIATACSTAALAGPIGQFAEHGYIGQPASPGAASYNPTTGTYTITGFGRNMWADHDDFHYAWKRMSGDVLADTRLDFVTPRPASDAGGFLHRKGGIILREDLDPDSAYVDVLRMGNQQMSLQYREVKGGPTRLIWINTPRQDAVRLMKLGDYAYIYLLSPTGELRPAGGSFKIHITGTYYIGVGVCPHDDKAHETMIFKDVRIGTAPRGADKPHGETLQTINVSTAAEQTIVYHSSAPVRLTEWSRDSRWVHFTSNGMARRAIAWDSDTVETTAPQERPAPTEQSRQSPKLLGPGLVQRISPDGKWTAYLTGTIARTPFENQDVVLHVAPMIEGKPIPGKATKLVKLWGSMASLPPSAWSPDSKTIAFISRD